mmetsp:Transcript_158957/g.293235  ORF Transcript_158957/g.293235 Transcript_158957/m.293235 type:complete len:766 (+) Transcript_158957:80-2377(+)
MAALKNNYAASQKRGPQRFKQQGGKTNGGAEIATASSASTAAQSKSQRSSGQQGPRRGGRAPVTQKAAKKATAARNAGNASGKAGESCAWPAYARSAAEAEEEVLEAIRSLYADELKPFGRILRKRVAERILQGNGQVGSITKLDALPEVDAKQVRAVCDGCELLQVQEEDGGDWSAVVGGQPSTFVDVYSPEDCYHPQLWCGLRTHCESSAGQDLSLPGGRYACAQALMALQLPLLAGFSLGRICHIVQLAISQKKILGYMNGAVVPYARSQSMMKEQCAMYGQPTTGNGNDQNNISILPIASLEVARKHVLEILETAKGEAPLSNIKRLFRSKYQIDLSETTFGYSKLSELIQGPHFSDICRVELRGHGYTVIQTGGFPCAPTPAAPLLMSPGITACGFRTALLNNGPRRIPLCADEPLSFDDMDTLNEGSPMVLVPTPTPTPLHPAARRWCLSPSKDKGDGFINYSVQHTFLQYKVPQTPLPGPKRRSHSLPKDMGRSKCPSDEEICAVDCKAESALDRSLSKFSHASESTTDADSSGPEGVQKYSPPSHKRTDSGSSSELSRDEASFGHVPQLPGIFRGRTPGTTPLPSTPSPVPRVSAAASVHAWQFPTSLESLSGSLLRDMDADYETGVAASASSEVGKHRVTFCPDEPLGFDEAGLFPTSPKPSSISTPSPALVPETPSPLYNYSVTAPWRRHLIGSSPPQALPVFNFAAVPIGMQLACSGSFGVPPPAQSESVGSVVQQAPRNALIPGCVIRLGEYF